MVATDAEIRKDAQWFGEKQSRVVVSLKKEDLKKVEEILQGHKWEELGVVTDGSIEVDGMNWGRVEEWKERYDTAIEKYLTKEEAGSALISI